MRRFFVYVILVCVGAISVPAQTGVFNLLNENQYFAKVKLVDEFFARFNGEEKRKDLNLKNSDRESNILLLFDFSKFKSKKDLDFIKAKSFAHDVYNNNYKIHFEDKNWFAKIKCHGRLGKKEITFPMFLCVEMRDSGMYKWVISDVEGEMFCTSRDKSHKEFFLMPNDNEQFFQSIRRATTETSKYIDDYVKNDYKVDALSVFLTLVRSNQLKIDAVTDVEFCFLQIPGYIFTVKYFERESLNAGWLIDSCKMMTDTAKVKLLKKLHK